MQIHELKPHNRRKRKKRIGRGGKRGTYSGKGQKGQRARAGRKIRPADRDIILKFPKLRGVKNKPRESGIIAVNVGDLKKYMPGDGSAVIDAKNILSALGAKRHKKVVKILGRGDIKSPVILRGVLVSKSAKKKIERTGGKIINPARDESR